MPNLDRYTQQYSPSGRVGPQEVNPEALTNTGAELPWRGVEAAGGAVAGLADPLQAVQDMEDELEISTAERQVGESMAKLWDDIGNEPDYKKHQALYSRAFETAQQFAPKSPRAARVFKLRINADKAAWDGQFNAMSTRRRINTIDSDSQANIALDTDRLLKSIEVGDGIESGLASKRIDTALAERVSKGLITQPEMDLARTKIQEQVSMTATKADALEILSIEGLDGAQQFVAASGLTDAEKDHITYDLRFHADKQRADTLSATKAMQEQSRKVMVNLLHKNELTPDAVLASPLDALEQQSWLDRLSSHEAAKANGEVSAFEKSDPHTYAEMSKASWSGELTQEAIEAKRGAGLSNDDADKLSLRIQTHNEGKGNPVTTAMATRYHAELKRLYTDGVLFEDVTYKTGERVWGMGGFTHLWKVDKEIHLQTGKKGEAGGVLLSAEASKEYGRLADTLDRFIEANPDAKPETIQAFYDELVEAPKKRAIGNLVDRVKQMESTRAQEQVAKTSKYKLPEEPKDPTTPEDFLRIYNSIPGRDDRKKYYEKWAPKWQPKNK